MALFGDLGGMALLKEVCDWEQTLRNYILESLLTHSFWGMLVVSSLLLPPAVPLTLWNHNSKQILSSVSCFDHSVLLW